MLVPSGPSALRRGQGLEDEPLGQKTYMSSMSTTINFEVKYKKYKCKKYTCTFSHLRDKCIVVQGQQLRAITSAGRWNAEEPSEMGSSRVARTNLDKHMNYKSLPKECRPPICYTGAYRSSNRLTATYDDSSVL